LALGRFVKTAHPYGSPVANRLTDYVALRRSLGFELRTQVFVLGQFDRVLQRTMKRSGPVTRSMVESYLASLVGTQPLTRRVRLSTIRQFLLYLRQFEPRTFIPDRFLLPGRPTPRAPHIYTEEGKRSMEGGALPAQTLLRSIAEARAADVEVEPARGRSDGCWPRARRLVAT
jgi:hypothetical protein